VIKTAIFGGAFDPPHLAHIALAQAAIQQLALDRLHVVPTGEAWHKAHRLSAGAHRLAMCRLAFAGLPRVRIDERELLRSGPTYTIDTLTELRAENPGAQLFLQIGADQAAVFHTWRRARDILDMAVISIAPRMGDSAAAGSFNPRDPLPGLHPGAVRVRLLKLPLLPHSATGVRQRLAAGLPTGDLVTPAIAGYIAEHHLYPNH
jgi:nicotinate-nucleotide adenylyltransferase